MISVTRLDGSAVLINVDLIMTIEQTPDTIVMLTTGDAVHVREAPQEIADRILRYKRELGAGGGR
jgi:flagellar protein FlbD